MKYGLTLVPQGIIPRDTSLKLKLFPETTGNGTAVGKCVDRFAGYFVSGIPADDTLPMTWDWPAGSWTAVITGFSFICKPPATYTWTVTPANFTLGTPPIATEGLDPNGNPTLTVVGTFADDLDGTALPVLNIVLNINGKPVGQTIIFKPATLNFYADVLTFNGSALPYLTAVGVFSPDTSSGGQAGRQDWGGSLASAPPGTYDLVVVLQAFNAVSTLTWNPTVMFQDVGVTGITFDTSGGIYGANTCAITFTFDNTLGSTLSTVDVTVTDDITLVQAPRAGGVYEITTPA